MIGDLEWAVRESLPRAQPVTHLGLGEARVYKVASNRRILGPDGKVRAVRWTATKDPAVRAEPEGTIDPIVSLVSLWNGERPVAVLTTHHAPSELLPHRVAQSRLSRGWPVSCAKWPSPRHCTSISTEPAGISAPAV